MGEAEAHRVARRAVGYACIIGIAAAFSSGSDGMLYLPGWNKAARERIVSEAYLREIQIGGREEIFLKGELGNRLATTYFLKSSPSANHWQWDGIWDDGDMFKSGVFGQGIYVSPGKDLVIVWQSTVLTSNLTQYAREIVGTFRSM